MFGIRPLLSARNALVVGAIAGVAALLGTGVASADVAVDNSLNWNGSFPIIGNLDPILTETTANLPSPVTVGTPSPQFAVTVKVDAPTLAVTGLDDVSAATLQGSADVSALATDSAGKTYPIDVPLTIPSTPTPAAGSDLVFTCNGNAQIPAIANAGPVTITVTGASTTLDPKQADGSDTVLGTFTVTLALDATGPTGNPSNNTTLGTITANPAS